MASTLIVGSSGTGKSFVATSIALQDLRRGRMVFANFDIKGCQRFGLEDLPYLPPGRIIIDEAASWFHSRRWKHMSDDLLGHWNQTRKDGWELLVLTQHENNIDATIKRNLTYGILLQPCWKALSRFDPRVKALARIMTEKRQRQFLEYVDAGLFPERARLPVVRAKDREVQHPLYIIGRKWLWDNGDFRSKRKGHRPIATHRWLWSWEVAQAYDTTEKLAMQSSKEVLNAQASEGVVSRHQLVRQRLAT
jgi:ABC-type dipeptide/oligopeptide/nickel transport system ATPase component